ncbi:MAG: RNA polymerase sigma factor [Pseudomonadota bacterium]
MQESILVRAYIEHELELRRFLGARLGSASLAADLAHELFLKLQRLDNREAVRDGRAYLFSMAANLATDYLRVEKRRGELRAEVKDIIWHHKDELTPERHAMARDELNHLRPVIDQMEPRCRKVFFLNRYEGKSQVEICAELGIGRTTVNSELKKAMKILLEARREFQNSHALGKESRES